MQWTKYLALPPEITPFEQRFLKRLNRIALLSFYLHIPVLMAVAWVAGTGPWFALALTLMVLTGPTIAYRALQNPRGLSVVYGVTAMLMGGLLVHFGQGPVQIEMHFYFFALLAMLCIFANPMVNLAAALAVALHHLMVWWFLPGSVFNYDAQWWVVLVHAAFVILETAAACYISREFFDNVIGLERIVEARTTTIREQQRDMRLILNNLEEGVITINLDGQMSGETSRAVEDWFGAHVAGEHFAAWIGQKDANFGEWFELALEGLKEGMPTAVALSQLPARLKNGEKTYAVHYQLITNADARQQQTSDDLCAMPLVGSVRGERVLEKLMVIITDITNILRKDAVERRQGELLQVFKHMLRDKTGFLEFLGEADDIVESLEDRHYDDLDHLKRLVHTLKGNTAMFGMTRVSEICHDLETKIVEQGEAPTTDMVELEQAWGQIRSDIEMLLGEGRKSGIEIDDYDYAVTLKALRDGVDAGTVTRIVESWRLESAEKRLLGIGQQIRGIADRMGKSNVSVYVEPNDLRFNSERFAPFWSAFIHVLRNVVDHGIEDGEERQRVGKPAQSVIRVGTVIVGDRFVVAVEDDGPGVDWEKLRTKASHLGVALSAIAEPLKLLCLPGLSSKDTVTELSGRGIGMGVAVDACQALGGTIKVMSRRGIGTRFEFAFPKDLGVYEGHAAILQSAAILVAT